MRRRLVVAGMCAFAMSLAACGGGSGVGPQGRTVDMAVLYSNVTTTLQQQGAARATAWVDANLEVGDTLTDSGQRYTVRGIIVEYLEAGYWGTHLSQGATSGPAIKTYFYDASNVNSLNVVIILDRSPV